MSWSLPSFGMRPLGVDDLQSNNLLLQGQIQEQLVVGVSHQGSRSSSKRSWSTLWSRNFG
jgi:hypothetical protein